MGRQGKRKEVFEDVKKKQMEVWQEIQDLMEKRSESGSDCLFHLLWELPGVNL